MFLFLLHPWTVFWCSVPKPAKPAESEPTKAGEVG